MYEYSAEQPDNQILIYDQTFQQQHLDSCLQNPQKLICTQCFVPLKSLTKIIACIQPMHSHIDHSQLQWKVLCVPCFAGWSPHKIDPRQMSQINYKIWFCKPLTTKLRLTQINWTLGECLQLFSCAQKYGPHVNSKFYHEFISLTGKNLSQSQLQEQFRKISSDFFDEDNPQFSYQLKKDQSQDPSQLNQMPFSPKLLDLFNRKSPAEIKDAQRFVNILQQQNPNQNLRKYPDNHAQFMARVLTTSPLTKDRVVLDQDRNQLEQNQNRKFIDCFREHLSQKLTIQERYNRLSFKYCEKYVKMSRTGRSQIDFEDKEAQKLKQLTHPEVSKLMEDEELGQILGKMVRLGIERSEVLEEVKQNKKNFERRRKSERRLGRSMQPSLNFEFQQSEEEQKPQQIPDPFYVRQEEIDSSEQS